ncbi:non-motile and phage-resistance protein [bacterium BMS3Abin07]|nr:non-motile and phage-resistance protein [bacterium BMS3Abin07]
MQMIKILLAGGNIGGSAILSLLREEHYTEIVGLFEKKHEAPAVLLARKWEIPVFEELEEALNAKPEIVINVTGNPLLKDEIRKINERVEIVEGTGAKLLWEAIERQKKSRIELMRSIDDQKRLYEFSCNLQTISDPDLIYEMSLDMALELSASPAGCIVMFRGNDFKVIVRRGLSRRFVNSLSLENIPEPIFESVVKNEEIFEIKDTGKEEWIEGSIFMSEKIRAVIAIPVKIEKDVEGVLFLYDFKPRHFPRRQKTSLALLLAITEVALYWFERMRSDLSISQKAESAGRDVSETSLFEDVNKNLERMVRERTQQLHKINEELEKTNRTKSLFIANMSHELRTPLNSIIGFSNVLLERTFGDLTENQQRYIENMNAAGQYLLELINNVLDIAKIESGKLEIELDTFRVEDVLQEVIGTMQPIIDGKLADFEIEIDDRINVMTADRVKLKQILYNLVSNAVKFSSKNNKAGIKVGRRNIDSSEYIVFSVWDNGVGIPPEDMERVFHEFEQVDTAFSKKYGGVGLGLALTKKLVELHSGDIWAKSRVGEGSTFSFTIPVMTPVEKKISPPVQDVLPVDFPWLGEDAPLILVVEDDVATAELLTIHLTQSGYKVAHAYDGEEAIKKAKEQRPFAITLDVMIPKKDGWEVLQILKSDPDTSGIPVIIHSVIENKDLAFALGATDYLMKPLDKDVLLKKLDDISVAKGKVSAPTTILFVVPDEKEVEDLKDMIGEEEVLFYTAETGKRGLELASALRPNLIILDFELPDLQILDFVGAMKEAHTTRDIPIFLLSQSDLSVEDRMNLVGKIERIMKKHTFETSELIDHIKDLEILYPRKAGLIDECTGLLSHRYFQLRLAQEVERASRYKIPLILVFVDIDDFGNYMEQKGDHYANGVLRKVSELLRKNIRGSDVVVRYSGDKFAVLLPNTVLSAGLSLSNRFNAIIKNYPFLYADIQPRGRITVSVGLVFLDGQSPEEFILCAEKALKRAIEKGGDRVEVYEEESRHSTIS